MLAMSSAIYAHGVLVDPDKPNLTGWVDVDSSYVDPKEYENYLPPNPSSFEIPLKAVR
jgi:hypothetical protein